MRKLFAVLLTLALVLGLSAALADQTVTVTGSGEVLVTADTAVVSLGVSTRTPAPPHMRAARSCRFAMK